MASQIISTYALVTSAAGYNGGVLNLNGDFHFVPSSAAVGQKVNINTNIVSTYSLVFTRTYAYSGGALALNGDIHFAPNKSDCPGQKVSAAGVVSTYDRSVADSTYVGGVTAPNGDIHFIPYYATTGFKLSSSGVVSSYALVNSSGGAAYCDGVFVPQTGDIHFIPNMATTGQKVNYLTGIVSTYSLICIDTVDGAYWGGVLRDDEIHMIPMTATVGQKVNVHTNKVSTYSLVYTHNSAYMRGVLNQNGDIIFSKFYTGSPGQKIDKYGKVSTYTFPVSQITGNILTPNGDIYFVPENFGIIQKETTLNKGLIFYAPLDEKEGVPHDIIGGLDGIISGNPRQNRSGLIGPSCQFSGSTDWIDFGRAVDLSGITSACTVSIWCYPTDQVGTSVLISKENWSTDVNGFCILIIANGANFNAAGYVSDATTTQGYTISTGGVYINKWNHLTFSWDGSYVKGSVNGSVLTATAQSVIPKCDVYALRIAHDVTSYPFYGKIDEISLWNRTLNDDEILQLYNSGSGLTYPFGVDNSKYVSGESSDYGRLPSADNNTINLNTWERFKNLLNRSVEGGSLVSKPIVSTFSLVYTVLAAYSGAVLSSNGDVHFVPYSANRGQKININGVVSTYSLVYTTTTAYIGGVLSPNGDIHFAPYLANRGQKINASGVVSTYTLVYTNGAGAYTGIVLDSNGNAHFVPRGATVGQKVSSTGVVSTYSLIYTGTTAYSCGVLSPNGDVHFVPRNAEVGQKVSSAGVVSTYFLVYTSTTAYIGGVLSPNGDIHFIPRQAAVGQKININGVVSTYSLIYTNAAGSYQGGALDPNGDIHFMSYISPVGQKVDINGVVSTYSLVYTVNSAFTGGILSPNGNIYMNPYNASVGQKITTMSAIPFSLGVCCSPFFNKY